MPLSLRRSCLSTVLALLATGSVLAQDELGLGKMWTFERPPLAYLQREYGFQPDEAWWNRMRLASLRFGRGCSASFVSPQGLILTNHHCVRDRSRRCRANTTGCATASSPRELADEVRSAGLTVQQLVRMRDVTAEVGAGVAAAMRRRGRRGSARQEPRTAARRGARDARPGSAAAGEAVPGRRLAALRVPRLRRRPAGDGAAPADRALRRRSRQLRLPALRARLHVLPRLRRRQARGHRRRRTSCGATGRTRASWCS
jgi:hypothetical protein